jgi:SagB-type dehydrogenase family enzyme
MTRNLLLLSIILFVSSCAKQDESVTSAPGRSFLKGALKDVTAASDMKKGVPAPPIQKEFPKDAKLIDLVAPQNITPGKMSAVQAINDRRSRRQFTDEKLTLEELSCLLWNTQGVQALARADDGSVEYHLRTVPSGGARHPFETYLLVNRVESLDPGIYRYLPVDHKLLPLYGGEGLESRITRACFGAGFPAESAVMFVWAALPRRTEWKYTDAAYKMIAIEAGHVCQNLYISCESIGLGTCAMLGYNQLEMDALIGVDGEDEFTVYIAPVGRRVNGEE